MTWTLKQLAQWCGGTVLGGGEETAVTKVVSDSRKIEAGCLFVALQGEKHDGHDFVEAAVAQGAAGVLVQKPVRDGICGILVNDTVKAYGAIAAGYRGELDAQIIGVTGSVGKTTAKDMIACVLGQKYNVLKTEGNFNNNLGMPLTILRLTDEHTMCVLEMGMDRFGEIDYLAGAVKPDVGVITNIGDAHIERLGSRENIFKAKCELLPHVKSDGLLILNGDDSMLWNLHGTLENAKYFGENYNFNPVEFDKALAAIRAANNQKLYRYLDKTLLEAKTVFSY